MNEQEWFESSDPVAMWNHLHYSSYEESQYGGTSTQSRHPPLISKRKANRFACICSNRIEDEKLQIQSMMGLTINRSSVIHFTSGESLMGNSALWSQHLRDIVVNPFSFAVRGPKCFCLGAVSDIGCNRECEANQQKWQLWLTPTVVSLAQACYDHLQKVKCTECEGWGKVIQPSKFTLPTCSKCGGNGTINTGQLDSDRLGILSDAIEDAGCDEEVILRSLRGEVQTCEYVSLGKGAVKGIGKADIAIKTIIWKKREVPLFPGFWITDLLLNLE